LDTAASRLGAVLGLGVLPCLVAVAFLVLASRHGFGFDFRVFWQASRDVLAGRSPYVSPAAVAAAPPEAAHAFFVYPPPVAFLLIPFTFLPYPAAAAIWIALILASIPLLLLALGVRDWRCHALTLLAASSLAVVTSGSVSAFLALGAALLWRYRDRRLAAALLVGAIVVAKLYLWPLLVWLIAIRGGRTAALGLATAAGLAVAGWAVTGFAGLTAYPHRVSSVASLEQGESYSPVALALSLGGSARAGGVLAVAGGVALLVGVFRSAGGADGEQRSFVLAIAATFAFSPISWLHYFVLLAVPIALASPAFALLWVLPLGFWVLPMKSGGDPWRIALAEALAAAIVVLAARRRRATSA